MKFLRKLLLVFFDLIDKFFHQKRIEKFIRKNKIKLDTCIDVGAFMGKYTDLIFKIQKNCKIILIEPQTKYYSLLKEKYKNNYQVEVLKMGLSNKEAILELKINKHEIASTFSEFKNTNRYLNLKAILFESKLENMTANKEKVKVFPLNAILKEKNLYCIDLIKIDTEGHEYEVLCGLQNYLKKINYILIEFHIGKIYENYSVEKIHKFLIENNFLPLKTFKFPFTTWEDRIYKNSEFKNKI